jgi:serine/threonine protein phosphatase PrpC
VRSFLIVFQSNGCLTCTGTDRIPVTDGVFDINYGNDPTLRLALVRLQELASSDFPYGNLVQVSEKFMSKKTGEIDTVEIPMPAAPADEGAPPTDSALVRVDLAALSHQGLVRPNNEDHYLVARFGRTMERLLTNLPAHQLPDRSDEVGYTLLVADGMGGAAAGELASQLAISTLVDLALRTPDWIFGTSDRLSERVERRMAERYRQVDAALREEAEADPKLHGMGTTMTLACSLGSRLVIGHIGDSRAYLFRNGALHQLTRDHTLVQSLVDAGVITAEQAAKHPHRHVLTRSLGGNARQLEGDFQHVSLADNDQLLICTDGLTDMVDNREVASVLMSAASVNEVCDTLVALALKNGGKDNVTVLIARYHIPAEAM